MSFVDNGSGTGIGAFPAQLKPAQKRLALNDNYLSFNEETFL